MQTDAVGKTWPATTYAVGREKIREFARATQETEPLHLDLDAARAAGWADLVAPPMFAAVYCAPAVGAALFDPEVGIDFSRTVHAAQEFVWERPVVAGDELATIAVLHEVAERGEDTVVVFRTTTSDARGATVCVGTWTNVVRGGS